MKNAGCAGVPRLTSFLKESKIVGKELKQLFSYCFFGSFE